MFSVFYKAVHRRKEKQRLEGQKGVRGAAMETELENKLLGMVVIWKVKRALQISNHVSMQGILAEYFLCSRLCPRQEDIALNKSQLVSLYSLQGWPGCKTTTCPFLPRILSFWHRTFTFMSPRPGQWQEGEKPTQAILKLRDLQDGLNSWSP